MIPSPQDPIMLKALMGPVMSFGSNEYAFLSAGHYELHVSPELRCSTI